MRKTKDNLQFLIKHHIKGQLQLSCLLFLFTFILVNAQVSGLSKWLGDQLSPLQSIPPWAIAIVVCLMIATFTECTSNVATATLFLPILASMVRTHLIFTMIYILKLWSSQINKCMLLVHLCGRRNVRRTQSIKWKESLQAFMEMSDKKLLTTTLCNLMKFGLH